MEAYREWITLACSLTTYPYGETAGGSFCHTLVPQSSRVRLVEQRVFDNFGAWLWSYCPGKFDNFAEWLWHAIPSETRPDLSNRKMELLGIDRFSNSREQNRSYTIEIPPQTERLDYDAILTRLGSNLGAVQLNLEFSFNCINTRFFVTSGRYMGRGSKSIQEGDPVALIAGVNTPVIIRKEGDLYRIKGPAYIRGVMNGEKWPENENEDLTDIVLS